MPAPTSAGLLMYRVRDGRIEVLLVHPGGPYWAKRDQGAWSIPKGEVGPGEDLLAAARREFAEETGLKPHGPFVPLGGVKYKGHKIVYAWAFEGDCDPARLTSVTFELEWPPRSGRRREFPEVDRGAFFDLVAAKEAVLPAQRRYIDDLEAIVGGPAAAVGLSPDGRSPDGSSSDGLSPDGRSPDGPAAG